MMDECPICMDAIDPNKNRVTTECGHTFHCSCLMTNVSHNGFACPYCRTAMAEEVEGENEYNDDYSTSSWYYGPNDDDSVDDFETVSKKESWVDYIKTCESISTKVPDEN